MIRETQARETIAAPDYVLGPYASGPSRLILVIGSQKIVRHFDEAMRRIGRHVFPYEEELVYERMKIHTFIGKI